MALIFDKKWLINISEVITRAMLNINKVSKDMSILKAFYKPLIRSLDKF